MGPGGGEGPGDGDGDGDGGGDGGAEWVAELEAWDKAAAGLQCPGARDFLRAGLACDPLVDHGAEPAHGPTRTALEPDGGARTPAAAAAAAAAAARPGTAQEPDARGAGDEGGPDRGP